MNEKKKFVFNAYYAIEILYFLSLAWISYHHWNFIPQRPKEIYEPMSYFGRILSPGMPSLIYYYLVFGIAYLTNFLLLITKYKNVLVLRILHVLCLLWINSETWSFGYLSHVGHLFILSFLMALFIKRNIPDADGIKWRAKSYAVYFGTLLLTYTMSASWKIFYVLYDAVKGVHGEDWAAPKAMLYNAANGHALMNTPFTFEATLVSIPILPEIAFWAITIVMLTAFISVLNYKYFRFTLFCLMVFHIANMIIVGAFFWIAPLVLLIFLLPYDKMLNDDFAELR